MCVCVFYIGGHTLGPTVMDDHIYPWEVIGYISFWYPNPLGRGEAKEWFWRSVHGDPPREDYPNPQ